MIESIFNRAYLSKPIFFSSIWNQELEEINQEKYLNEFVQLCLTGMEKNNNKKRRA